MSLYHDRPRRAGSVALTPTERERTPIAKMAKLDSLKDDTSSPPSRTSP
jgi:hypothetical protein